MVNTKSWLSVYMVYSDRSGQGFYNLIDLGAVEIRGNKTTNFYFSSFLIIELIIDLETTMPINVIINNSIANIGIKCTLSKGLMLKVIPSSCGIKLMP